MTTLSRKDTNCSASIEYRCLTKANLMVIDDIMMVGPDARRSNAIFHFINDIYEKASIIITTNKSPKQWVEKLGDEVLTAAILDRILHHEQSSSWTNKAKRKLNKKEVRAYNRPS